MHASLFGGPRRTEPVEPERGDCRIDVTIEHHIGHKIGRHRGQKDSVTMMTRGIDQTLQRTSPEDRRIIAAPWPMPDPSFQQWQILDRRHKPPCRLDERQHSAGRERGVESLLLHGRAQHQSAVKTRNQVDVGSPKDVRE